MNFGKSVRISLNRTPSPKRRPGGGPRCAGIPANVDIFYNAAREIIRCEIHHKSTNTAADPGHVSGVFSEPQRTHPHESRPFTAQPASLGRANRRNSPWPAEEVCAQSARESRGRGIAKIPEASCEISRLLRNRDVTRSFAGHRPGRLCGDWARFGETPPHRRHHPPDLPAHTPARPSCAQ